MHIHVLYCKDVQTATILILRKMYERVSRAGPLPDCSLCVLMVIVGALKSKPKLLERHLALNNLLQKVMDIWSAT